MIVVDEFQEEKNEKPNDDKKNKKSESLSGSKNYDSKSGATYTVYL
jgi:hypothetical protein